MKINEYFLEAKKISLSDEQKSQIFDDIHRQIASNSTPNYIKMLKYIAISSGVVMAVFAFVPIFNQPTNIQLKNGLLSSIGGSSVVKADQVGEILNLEGNIFINGVESKETKIFENQNLFLGSGKIEFNIGSGSKGIIIGPANFAIHRNENKYEIEIISGNYVQIIEKDLSAENIVVKTKQLSIAKTDNSKPFGVTLTTNSGDVQITSQSQNLDIQTEKGEKFVLKAASTITFDDKNKPQIEEKIALNQTGSSQNTGRIENENEYSKVAYQPNSEKNNISNSNYTNFSSSKISIDEEKAKKLEPIIYSAFLKQDIQQYKSTYENGDEAANILAYQNITSRINRVYETLDIDYKIDPTSINVGEISQNLQKELKNFEQLTSGYQTQDTKKFVQDLNLITVRKFGYKTTKKPTSSSSVSSISSTLSSENSSSSQPQETKTFSGNNFSSLKNIENNIIKEQNSEKNENIMIEKSSNDGNGEKK